MRGLLLLFGLVILFLSASMGSVAHAMEGIDCANLPKSVAWAHSDRDDTQTPDVSDPAVPHRHADCHGHHIAVAMAKVAIEVPPSPRTGYRTIVLHGNAAAIRAADLRPPIA